MSGYNFPFKSSDFDIIYTNIAETLKVKFPQENDETIITWHRRLLYELMHYIQSQFEEEDTGEVIKPKNKNRKKKKNRPTPVIVKPLFSDDIERSLEIIYQDSNFAIYLMAWFFPILVNPTDTYDIYVTLDNSETPAETVPLHSVSILLEQGIYKVTICVNGKKLNSLTPKEYELFCTNPFLHEFIRCVHYFQYGNNDISYSSVTKIHYIAFDCSDPQMWSFRLSRFMWSIKTLLEPLYIDNIEFKTNLEPTVIKLKKAKKNKAKKNRKRFNEQKYISAETATVEQMSAQIIRTLVVSTFRTFYDFDPSTISDELFDYLFHKKSLTK